MPRRCVFALLLTLLAYPALASTQPVRDVTRGELLYSTHCIACHSSEVHWRDKRLARDWNSLRAEVRRWQRLSGLGWGNDDITAVARYLNGLYYHFPAPD